MIKIGFILGKTNDPVNDNFNKVNDCFIHNKKNIFYFDSEHLSSIGSKMLEKPILEIINGFK